MAETNDQKTPESALQDATYATAATLRRVVRSADLELTRLTLNEADEMIDAVARVVPAGNVPALILSGLIRLSGRKTPADLARRDVNILFQSVSNLMDKAVYGAVFAGPAAVIWGYQTLLRLAGKHPDDAFPEGTWQFYVDYALREDTARHTNETHGFDTALKAEAIALSRVDRIAAWVMTAVQILHDYDAILENEWRERVYTAVLSRILAGDDDGATVPRLYRAWMRLLPYRRSHKSRRDETYIQYRRRKFDSFIERQLSGLSAAEQEAWSDEIVRLRRTELRAYKRQMTIKAFLKPDTYGETRMPVNEWALHVGLVVDGRYYLIPIWHDGRRTPPEYVRGLVAQIIAHPAGVPRANIAPMSNVKRAGLTALREDLPSGLYAEMNKLRLAPILFNADQRPDDLPLAAIRQAERGTGDHALTIFDTGRTLVFDQSHIFFDGTWGAAFAEIMTNEATEWARKLAAMPALKRVNRPPHALHLHLDSAAQARVHSAPRIVAEVGVEDDRVDLRALLGLRHLFKQRSDLLQLTVNDILVLYRAIHAITYTAPPELIQRVKADYGNIKALYPMDRPPAILIPVDCSQRSPRDRLHPISFEVPLAEFGFIERHQNALDALTAYLHTVTDRSSAFRQFNHAQRGYLASLAGFGALMTRAKSIAATGESASVSTIKLLAHLPRSLQRWLDTIPHQFDTLNDLIKGREVFSNIGKVAPGSSLTRFIAAKDDNEKKTLAWGVLTDDAASMRISLRDFRPHVTQMIAAGQSDLAEAIAADYLAAYVDGLNTFVDELTRITLAGRSVTLITEPLP